MRASPVRQHWEPLMFYRGLSAALAGSEGRRIEKAGCRVLHPFEFFAGRDDSSAAQVRRTQDPSPVRQHWGPRAESVSPGTGRKNPGSGASFAPFRGWLIGDLDPPWMLCKLP